MSEERAQILKMLVAGRVTVEQADQLLVALDAAPPTTPHEPALQTERQPRWDERVDDGFASLAPEQLIELRDHGVSRAFIEQMREVGLRDLSVATMVELYEHGVTPHFVSDLREVGLTEITSDQLIEMYDHGVDAAYVRAMQDAGLTEVTPDQLIEMYDHGVSTTFVRQMRSQYPTDQSSWEEPGE